MDFASLISAMTARGLTALSGFDRDAAIRAGINPTRVNEWQLLHATYYGPTNAPKQQAAARDAALAGGYSLDQLLLIERRIKDAPDATTNAKRRALRLAMLGATDPAGGKRRAGSYKNLQRRLNDMAPKEEKTPKDKITFSKSVGNKRTMVVTTDERFLADLEHHLRSGIDASRPAGPQMLANFVALLRGVPLVEQARGGADGDAGAGPPAATSAATSAASPIASAVPQPLLLVPLDAWVKIMRGDGDDTVLGLTDGTTMTGAEFLNTHIATAANHLQAALFHPVEGPVNLYQDQRYANDKQRVLASAVTPVCPVPGCKTPADYCQTHHITAWKHGGETNLDNLVPLCSYHNHINDDDPPPSRSSGGGSPSAGSSGDRPPPNPPPHGAKGREKPRNAGRIVKRNGRPVWRSPNGYSVANSHPNMSFGALDALFGAP